jgi:uncharacterized protein YcfJ
MITNLQKTVAALLVAIVFPAWAGHNNGRYVEPGYDYAQYDYARVINARPVYEFVQVPRDRRVCGERPVRHRVAEHRSQAPAIFGAVLGGVIGNQLSRNHGHGHGGNRAVATVAGAAIGGAIASEIQYSKYPARYYTENARVCATKTSWHNEERVVAWDVSWKYHGRVYHSRMAERPGKRIRVRVGARAG